MTKRLFALTTNIVIRHGYGDAVRKLVAGNRVFGYTQARESQAGVRSIFRKTAIVTDSTGYLPQEMVAELGIHVVPLNVTIGQETLPETSFSSAELFAKLARISGTSKTSQPSAGAFLDTYEALFAQNFEEIVSIHLSQGISGTMSSARTAANLASKQAIRLVDSGSAALGLGLLVWAAAEWAQQGLKAEEIVARLADLKVKTELYFMVETLEYLRRGGRIGGAAALVGTLLQIKPILYFNGYGLIDVFDKVRTKTNAWQRVVRELERALADGQRYRICIQHVCALAEGERILEEFRARYPGHDIRLFEGGPVIATHVGPGCLGLAFQPYPDP